MSDDWTEEAKKAANFLCSTPEYGSFTLKKDDLRSLMLNSGGMLLARGTLYSLVSEHIGTGVFNVTMKRKN